MLTTIQWPVRNGLVILAIALGALSLAGTENVANREASLGLSVTLARQYPPLAEPALTRAVGANREEASTELALPNNSLKTPRVSPRATDEVGPVKVRAAGIASSQPSSSPNLVEGVTIQEEIDFLVQLYSAKYGVDLLTLRRVVRCESTDDPWATGKEGERGFGQFLKSTFMGTPQKVFGWDAAYHPAVNLEAAAWMLQQGRVGEFHALQDCR